MVQPNCQEDVKNSENPLLRQHRHVWSEDLSEGFQPTETNLTRISEPPGIGKPLRGAEANVVQDCAETNQDAVYLIHFHAIIVCSSVLAHNIYKVISQKRKKTLFERLITPRPAPKIVRKGNWQSLQQRQPDALEGPTSAGSGKPLRGLQPPTSTSCLNTSFRQETVANRF